MNQQNLEKLYHDPSDAGSFGGVERLFRRATELKLPNISRKTVSNFLNGEQSYSLHKPMRRHFIRNHIYVAGIDAQWHADLADMQGLAATNDGMRYLLTVIDVFSKFAWAEPVKSKQAETITKAFETILVRAKHRQPRRLQTDKGKEFFNSSFGNLIKTFGIHHFASESDQKAAVVERFNRTIKSRIWTYLTYRGSTRWVDAIEDIIGAYNKSFHRSIGMAPIDVRKKDENRLWSRLYGDGNTYQKRDLPHGEMVRVSKNKGIFEKGYMPNWSKEHFIVSTTNPMRKCNKKRVYKIADYNGEPVTGSFYSEELQPITRNQYRIEKVLRKRTLADGTVEKFVRWEGWPEKFNSWIRESDEYNVAEL